MDSRRDGRRAEGWILQLEGFSPLDSAARDPGDAGGTLRSECLGSGSRLGRTAREWIVFWSSTIPGRFPDTDESGDRGYNHRLYALTTRDWVSFTPARLWFDPGFNAIDATLVRTGKRWRMIFKDERKNPLKKQLRLASADGLQGPWKEITEPFSDAWVEGPSAVQLGKDWWIYFDYYQAPRHYAALRTRDWRRFENLTPGLLFPDDQRHGSAVKISKKEAALLQSQ